jgi:hypothetical protein
MCANPKTEKLLPMRLKLLKETDAAKCTQSITDRDAPKRDIPIKEKAADNRA